MPTRHASISSQFGTYEGVSALLDATNTHITVHQCGQHSKAGRKSCLGTQFLYKTSVEATRGFSNRAGWVALFSSSHLQSVPYCTRTLPFCTPSEKGNSKESVGGGNVCEPHEEQLPHLLGQTLNFQSINTEWLLCLEAIIMGSCWLLWDPQVKAHSTFSHGLDQRCPASVFRGTLGRFLLTPVAFLMVQSSPRQHLLLRTPTSLVCGNSPCT